MTFVNDQMKNDSIKIQDKFERAKKFLIQNGFNKSIKGLIKDLEEELKYDLL